MTTFLQGHLDAALCDTIKSVPCPNTAISCQYNMGQTLDTRPYLGTHITHRNDGHVVTTCAHTHVESVTLKQCPFHFPRD